MTRPSRSHRDRELIIAVDSREQKPYPFSTCEVKTLETGDYSIVGLEDRVTIERKTKKDAYASLGRSRGRFERELKRMAQFDYAAIVIESSLPEFLRPPPFSQLSPRSAINSLLNWTVKYQVGIFFAGDRRHGQALTQRLLEKFWRNHQEIHHAEQKQEEAHESHLSKDR